MEIRKRILQYLDIKGISKYKFYQQIGVSNGFLDKDGSIGTDKCEKICYHYPDVNLYWLVTGKGPMLKKTSNIKATESPHEEEECTNCKFKDQIIESQAMQIKTLEKLIESQEDRIQSLKKLCDYPEDCAKKGDMAG